MERQAAIPGTRFCRCACGCARAAVRELCGRCALGEHMVHKQCQNCETLLTGRQTRWCSRQCNEVWHDPRIRIPILMAEQAGLCGICALPLGEMVMPTVFRDQLNPEIEVDHVRPQVLAGTNHRSNLRVAHRDCNRTKGALPLDEARRQIGAYDDVLIRRLIRAWAPSHAWRTILPPTIGNKPAASLAPHPASRQWPYSDLPFEQTALQLGS